VRTSPDALPTALARGLRGACLITGVEPLLIAEAAVAVRQAARAAGYADREVHFIERGFDWDELLRDAANLSLFASRRLIELKFNSTPDIESQRALADLAAKPPADTVLLVTGELERKSLATVWVKAFEEHGVLVVTQPVERAALPGWIRDRLAKQGIQVDSAATELIADRVEGNLLAAQQEVERIALLMPGATLGAEDVAALVADSARYDVFELSAAAFSGHATRALSRVSLRAGRERSLESVFRAEQVWSARQGPVKAALGRLDRPRIDSLITAVARTDRIAKGSLRGDVWVELEGLVARIAGVRLAA
jgi:DNA polymerase-3 subunit delta